MKRHVLTAIAIIFIYGVMVVGAHAQTAGSQIMRADIPFTFTVGQKSLPPGIYTVSILNPTSDRPALRIRSANGRLNAIIQTASGGGVVVDESKLVFRRYGDRYFFAQAQIGGDATTLTAAKSQAERATERSVVKQNGERGVVAIVSK
ncbi:MAG TPA: hypothetical protein VJS17_06175 [Pyrinomonadaceae bacterium]|nr:hypothetical protein [Pyrinomonadaceae bacterium]